MSKAFLTATLLASLCLPVQSQTPRPSAGPAARQANAASPVTTCRASRDDMRRALRSIQTRQKNIGLGAAVLLGDTFILSEGLGYADLEHQVPVTPETRFGIASVTKAFTGLAVLELHAAGRLDLDAPIQRYVPAFPAKPGGTITPRLLAAHRAGLRHWKDDERTPALYRPGLLSRASLDMVYARPPVNTAEPAMNYGWFMSRAGDGPRRIHINGSNAGLQSAVYVYPDNDLVTVVLSNTHGVGARSGEMVTDLPERLAALCMGWPLPIPPRPY